MDWDLEDLPSPLVSSVSRDLEDLIVPRGRPVSSADRDLEDLTGPRGRPVSRSLASLDPGLLGSRLRMYSFPWRRRSTASHILTKLRIYRRARYEEDCY